MSGGAFGYEQYKIGYIADEIKDRIVKNDDQSLDEWGYKVGRGYSLAVIAKLREAVRYLEIAQIYAHRADWLFSGDDGEDSFLNRLANDLPARPDDQRPTAGRATDMTITWHKCVDEMPEPWETVLAADTTGDVFPAQRFYKAWYEQTLDGRILRSGVTHWADLPAHPDDQRPDCRTCSKYLPPIYAFSEPACPRRKISMDPCINGSHYRPADPVRLYETNEDAK